MKVEISIGEVLDKISILSIKLNKIKDQEKLKNIQKEFSFISAIVKQSIFADPLYFELCKVNQKLWIVEDELREHEKINNFNEDFINLARSVYVLNDKRAAIKKEINIAYGSELIEEKSYNNN
jgi:hypothetical protein